uniref:PEHE domain-containing protein n=1 Tax=Leptobrachium leishanense TaxID=445787 RepID=A0A8C5PG99_9ANUR
MAAMAPALSEAQAGLKPSVTQAKPPELNGARRGPPLLLRRNGRLPQGPSELMASRQQELGARARRLCRRLHLIQAKQVERHVRQQLAGLVELLAAGGEAALAGEELRRMADSSTARLRAAQGGLDSDNTESSSGGESEGEAREEEEERSQPGGCSGRAEWHWALERAAIICRWTWLQAQVSDLEFRIRQQTEIYKQIRCAKGGVVLGDSVVSEDSPGAHPAGAAIKWSNRAVSSCHKVLSVERPRDETLPGTRVPPGTDKQCSRLSRSVENVLCQNPSTTSVSESSGSQKPSQVNGLINCVRSSASCNGSLDVDADDALAKRHPGVQSVSAHTDSSCVSARTRPLRAHKKRRLVRSSSVSSLSRKPQKPLSLCCTCEPPITCILCGTTYTKSTLTTTMALNERVALMDPGYHPILSFPHDASLNLHFDALLKEDGHVRISNKLKALKLSQLGKKSLDRLRRESELAGSQAHGRSDQERLSPYLESWQRNSRFVSDSTAAKSQLRRTSPSSAAQLGSLLRDDRQNRCVPSPGLYVSSPVSSRPSSTSHQLSCLGDSAGCQLTSNSANLKRKRIENSYDINNIVIPMSMAAASRVEKIQYKEILTPSWRVLDSTERDVVLDADPELEDLSGESYLDRHSAYEELERSRWDSWSSSAPQRRGSRCSNRSDGRWTPQPSFNSQGSLLPASPDAGFQCLNDAALTLSCAAPNSPEPYSTVQCFSVRSRTRVLSWSEETRSSTPEVPDEEEQIALPWERRAFPLSDRDFKALQNSPETPSRNRNKQPPDVTWSPTSKPSTQTESSDIGMPTESPSPSSREPSLSSREPSLPISISVVRFHEHSGDKIASLECFPARPVNKR